MCHCLLKISQSCISSGPETASYLCVAVNWKDLQGTLWIRNMSLVLQKKIQLSLSLNTSPCCPHVILILILFGGADILELVMWRWNLFLIGTKCHCDITWLRVLPRYERQAPNEVKLHHTPSYCPF